MEKSLGEPLRRSADSWGPLADAYRNIPPPLQGSAAVDGIMQRLEGGRAVRRSAVRAPRVYRKRLFARVCLLLAAFALVGGTCYAAYSEWLLPLKDKSGRETMQIAYTGIPAASSAEDRILADVLAGLKAGEQATVYIGRRAIQEQEGEAMPKAGSSYHIVVKPRAFASAGEMNAYLAERGIEIASPAPEWDGWKLIGSEVQNDVAKSSGSESAAASASPPASAAKTWATARDPQSGLDYKYAKGPSDEGVSTVRWTYRDGKRDREMTLAVILNVPVMPTFYDSSPSSDSILKLNGVDAYFYRGESDGERSIHWSEKLADDSYRAYTAFTYTAPDEELRRFAAAMIALRK